MGLAAHCCIVRGSGANERAVQAFNPSIHTDATRMDTVARRTEACKVPADGLELGRFASAAVLAVALATPGSPPEMPWHRPKPTGNPPQSIAKTGS